MTELERLQRRLNEYDERWKRENTCGICPYRKSLQEEVRRLRERVAELLGKAQEKNP